MIDKNILRLQIALCAAESHVSDSDSADLAIGVRTMTRQFRVRSAIRFPHAAGALAVVSLLACLAFATASPASLAAEYTLSLQFGGNGSQEGQLLKPHGVAVDETTHDVYVADTENQRVEKFSDSGTFIATWGWGVSDGIAQSEVCASGCQAGQAGSGAGQFTTPTTVAVDNSGGPSEGDVYVGDESNKQVEKFSPAGVYIASLSAGTGGPFSAIYGVAVDASGNLWIADSSSEVYEFDAGGSELQQWNTNFGATPGLAVDSNGDVYALRGCPCVQQFSGSGTSLGELDPNNTQTTGLVADIAGKDVFSDQGTFVARYDEPTTLPAHPVTTFGNGTLTSGTGVGVDESNGNVYVADASSDQVYMFLAPLRGAPEIKSVSAGKVLIVSANLRAKIYTGQFDTKYYFEYGTTAAYGSILPVGGADIGAGLTEVAIERLISGLTSGTTYHYRIVAKNSHGEVASEDQTFTTFSPVVGTGLPDGRVYELVSPPDKGGSDLGVIGNVTTQVASSGEAVTYNSFSSFGGSLSGKINQFLSKRGASGWSTQAIMPPDEETGEASISNPYVGFSGDLSMGVLTWPYAMLAPQAKPGYENLYVRDDSDGSFRLITTSAPPNGSASRFVGASSDYSHVVFEAGDALTANAVAGTKNVYQWQNGELTLVSIPPGSTTGVAEAQAGGGGEDVQNAVSSDGRLVFWSYGEGLYVRKGGVETVKVSASQRNPSVGDGSATFEGATPSGEWVFFSDGTELTEAAADKGGLYAFNTKSGTLEVLTPDAAGSPELQGLVGFGDDGSRVYFVADARLQTLATGGPEPIAGQPNFYVYDGGQLRFIATLGGNDGNDWYPGVTSRQAAVTPDGAHTAFMSSASLTKYNNTDAVTGSADTEVFAYTIGASAPVCVSCNPSGEAPIGASKIPQLPNASSNLHYISDDGRRVFFNSEDTLTVGDTNGVQDVYEWNPDGAGGCLDANGCVHLISTGTNASKSSFAAAGASGNDVFFATRSRLASQDIDENIDMYDARVDGGFPAPAAGGSSPCVGEACLGALSAPPAAATPLTALLPGGGASDDPQSRSGTFKLAQIGRRALRSLARTGRLTLAVTVSEAGRVWANITTRAHGRLERLASGSVTARAAGKVLLKLTLARSVRGRLARGHRTALTITVGYSKSATQNRVTITPSRLGSSG